MSYDKKYREGVLALIDSGKKQEEVRATLGLEVNTITKWKKLRAETGSVGDKPLRRKWRKIDPEKLQSDVSEYPDDFNPIEQVWANLKTFIKNYMRHFSALSFAIYHFFQLL